MEQHTDQGDRDQHRERRIVSMAPPGIQSTPEHDESGARQRETDQSERPVRDAAMPFEVFRRAAGGRHEVDVRRIRRQEERRGRAAARAAQRRARKRDPEQAVCDVVHV